MNVEAAGSPVDYEVTLEPHNRNWMFALKCPPASRRARASPPSTS